VSIFQRVIKDATGFLKPGGHLVFEIGAGQDRQVNMLFSRSPMFEAIRQEQDPQGVTRVVVGTRSAGKS
jgi:release factor glutamine methyltransferase